MPVSIEPPPPSAEQLADWKALIERIRQGDRSQLLAWDEAEAVRGGGVPLLVEKLTGVGSGRDVMRRR